MTNIVNIRRNIIANVAPRGCSRWRSQLYEPNIRIIGATCYCFGIFYELVMLVGISRRLHGAAGMGIKKRAAHTLSVHESQFFLVLLCVSLGFYGVSGNGISSNSVSSYGVNNSSSCVLAA